jgi:uncharacterized protein
VPAFKILSLDGGGVRGAYAAGFLAQLERNIGRPVAECFDLIAGTSTGGIIATALALGESAQRVEELYRTQAALIFKRRAKTPWYRAPFRALIDRRLAKHRLDLEYLSRPLFDQASLAAALDAVFGERTLESATARLVVPGVNLVTGRTVVFKTPHLPNMWRDRGYKATEVALSTAAAPTFFAHSKIGNEGAYCDGGLWANNPVVVAYAEALRICDALNQGADGSKRDSVISILSVGTGQPAYTLDPPSAAAGLGWWAPRLVDVILFSQSQGMEHIGRFLAGDSNYLRVNFALPDASWTLDNAAVVEQLIHLGHEAAHAHSSVVLDRFLGDQAPAFVKFPPRTA